MKDDQKTKDQLIEELKGMRLKLADLEKAEAEWRRISHIHALILDNSLIGICFVRKRIIEWANSRLPEMFGMTMEEISGASTRIIYPSDELYNANEAAAYPALERGKWFEFQTDVVLSDGASFIVHVAGKAVDPNHPNDGSLWLLKDVTAHKQAEAALEENEAKYRLLVDNSYDMIWTMTAEGVFTYVSPSWQKILGYQSADIVGTPFQSIVHPDDVAACEYYLRKMISTKQQLPHVEYRVRHADDTWRWHAASGNPVYNPDGSFLSFVGVSSDITLQRQTQEALKASEKLYRSVIENIKDTFYRTDNEGNLIMVSPSGAAAFGYESVDDMIGLNIAESLYVEPENRKTVLSLIRERGYVEDYEVTLKRRNGTIMSGSISSHEYYDDAGNALGIEGILRDITDRKKAQEALRVSEERFSKAFYMSPAPTIISTLEDGRYISVNDAFLRMLGYSREEMIGRTAAELNVWADYEERNKLLQKYAQQGFIRGEFIRLRNKSGETRYVIVSAELITLNADQYVLSIFYDITDRIRMENQLRQTQKMEAIGTLAGGIAHDFNNILGAIIGYTEMALGEDGISERLRRYLEQIYKGGERATDLVKQILTFSRRQDQERKPVLVAPIIKEGIKLLRSSLPSTVNITQDITQEPIIVLTDPTQMHQVLMNLCTNASHAMRERGGILNVQLSRESVAFPRPLHPLELHPGDYMKLTVGDTGSGIDPAIMERIFDPFFTTKNLGEGTGLGLSVVYGILRDHNGAVDIVSAPGKGTTVSLYFPLEDVESPLPERPPQDIPGGSERILFVDDEAVLVELGRVMLVSLGYHVTTRTSSIEALDVFRARPQDFDMVITDMTMPNMTGDRLATELLKLRPDVPIILCTGFSDIMSEEKARGIGVRRFVMKPIFIGEIATLIRDVLDKG